MSSVRVATYPRQPKALSHGSRGGRRHARLSTVRTLLTFSTCTIRAGNGGGQWPNDHSKCGRVRRSPSRLSAAGLPLVVAAPAEHIHVGRGPCSRCSAPLGRARGALRRRALGPLGYTTPPMFGDFEAQRHWMEVTVNLPPTAWYVDGRDNDLQYWGLDYPPLSAHPELAHRQGRAARRAAIRARRAARVARQRTAEAKTFMRRSVQPCDALVFLPAALAHGVAAVRGRHRWLPLLQLVLLPALVLVDHGHFQYNCVSLGLALWALTAALRDRPLACAAFCFTLALNFKQMSLYLAPAIFCYLLAGCLRAATKTAAALRVARLGTVVLATTALCWAPFLGSWATRAPSSSASSRSAATCTRTRWRACGARSRSRRSSSSTFLDPDPRPARRSASRSPRSTRRSAMLAGRGRRAPASSWARRRAHSPSSSSRSRCTRSTSLPQHHRRPAGAALPRRLRPARRRRLLLDVPDAQARRRCVVAPAAVRRHAALIHRGLARPRRLRPPRAARGRPAAVASGAGRSGASLAGMAALHAADLPVAPPARYPDLHAALFAAYACVHLAAPTSPPSTRSGASPPPSRRTRRLTTRGPTPLSGAKEE